MIGAGRHEGRIEGPSGVDGEHRVVAFRKLQHYPVFVKSRADIERYLKALAGLSYRAMGRDIGIDK